MNKDTFILMAMQTKDDFLGRFLNIPQDDVETMPDNAAVMDSLSDTYDQMPEDELVKFRNELTLSHDYITDI